METSLLEALPVGIWIATSAGKVVYENPAARRILCLDASLSFTAAPKAFAWNTLRPVGPDEWVWRRVLATGQPLLDHAIALESEDGKLRTVILSAIPFATRGSQKLVVVVGVDCSALIDTYAKLRRNVSLLRSTLESVTNGVLVVDTKGRIVIHNRLFAELWRIPCEVLDEAEDQQALAVALEHVRDPHKFLTKVHELYAKPFEKSFDVIELRDGRVLERYSRPQLLDGEPVGRVWSFWDVTDRKRQEEANERTLEAERLARSEADAARERLGILASVSAALMDALDDPVALDNATRATVPGFADWCVVDEITEAGPLRRVALAHADPAKMLLAQELRGLPPRADGTAGVAKVLRTGEPELIADVDDAFLAAVATSVGHLEALRRAGLRSALIVPMKTRGRTLGTIAFVYSESGRRYEPSDIAFAEDLAARIGTALDNARLYRTAREAIRARDELLSVVSHDLRNPISAIHASASLILRRHALPTTSASEEPLLRKNLELIQRSAMRMNGLIEDLLDAARLEAKQLRIETRPVGPESILHEAIELMEPLAVRKGIRLTVEVSRPLPTIEADRARLHQVLSNLIGNAIKFTPEGGRVLASAAPLGDAVCFSVSDTGAGISEADKLHIFERFWQAKKTAGLGVGLGLSIARSLVEAHGGNIWCSSKRGEGATFYFTIPVERPARAAAA